jgi:hypothetical protein
MLENTSQPSINAPANKSESPSGQSEIQSGRKYRGDITSKEAGDIVKNMIREQERVLMSEYEKNNKVQ